MKLLGLAALFAAGALLAGVTATVGGAQTTETTTETVRETTTEPTTVHETTTVQETTTEPATTAVTTETTTVTPTTTTAPAASESSGTPTWVWVVLAVLAAAVIGLLVALLTHRGGAAIPDLERRQRLQSAIASWTNQGWVLLSQTADAAVLQRGNERMTVSVNSAGQIGTQALGTQPPPWPSGTDPNAPTQRIDP